MTCWHLPCQRHHDILTCAPQQEPPKQLRRVAALAGAATADEPSVKAMNNYLGIGIDAKVTPIDCPQMVRASLQPSVDSK